MTNSLDTWRWAVVVVGVLLRVYHLGTNPPLWHDEAALVLNLLALDFRDFLGPLAYHQAAPPLYLCLERVALLALGDSETAMRVPAFLAGCAALAVFAALTRRVLPAGPALFATALFAVSDRLIWHSQEVKPYAFDVLVATAVAWGYLRTRDWWLPVQCLLWALVLPVALWLSYPACFVAGGLLIGLLTDARRAGWEGRLGYGTVGLAVAVAFAALILGPAAQQRDPVLNAYWGNRLADWDRPDLVAWMIVRGPQHFARYSLLPLGQFLLPVAVVGVVRLWRADRRLVVVLLAPLVLNLVAALVGRYPFGGGRVNAYLAPSYLLLLGAGVGPTWAWLRARGRLVPVVLVVFLATPLWPLAKHLVVPWPRPGPDYRTPVEYVNAVGPADAPIAPVHWEVQYYTRDRPDRVWAMAEVRARKPDRFWVITATDPPVLEKSMRGVPVGWRPVHERRFGQAVAILFERPDGVSTSPDGSVP